MPRASTLVIVLTLAIGPDAAILCQALCAPQADVTKACDHSGAGLAQIAAGGNCCDDMVAVAESSRYPAMRRGTSFPNAGLSVPVLSDRLERSDAARHCGYEPGRVRSLDHRPLPTILRL